MPFSGGYGGGSYGGEPWGSPGSVDLDVVNASAVAENVVRLVFSQPIYFSELLDAKDGSNPSKYVIAAVAGTTGLDGTSVRAVNAVSVAATDPTILPSNTVANTVFDVTLDRPMTPYPAAYTITVSNVWTADETLLVNSLVNAQQFLGLFKQVVQPNIDTGHPLRDFGNPQTVTAQTSSMSPQPPPEQLSLGTFYYKNGDYGVDRGIASVKKRIYRRLVTAPGGFAHLGNSYGVGVPQQAKKLLQSGTLSKLAALAEQQIVQEPEVKAVKVTASPDPSNTGLVNFRVAVSLTVGQSTTFVYPFSTAG